jgi:modulator of FtsH protease
MLTITNISEAGMARLKETYQYVFMGIVVAMIGAWATLPMATQITGWTFGGLVILEFAVLFAFFYWRNIVTYLTFTLLTGITLVPVLNKYLSAGMGDVVAQAFLLTAIITGGLTYYASTTKNNFLGIGNILFWILIGIIIVSVINLLFIGSSFFSLCISYVVVILFSFFIIHDTQEVLYTDIHPLDAAMGLYLDILNMFISLLNILGYGTDD